MGPTEELIRTLARQAKPVRRLWPPFARALAWIGLASLIMAVLALYHGVRPDVASKLEEPSFLVQLGAAWLTGAAATLAAFETSVPDHSRAWLLLPLPSLGLWLAGIGYGCLAQWIATGPDGLIPGESLRCLETIVLTSVPLSLLLWPMLGRARPLRPTSTAWLGGLAVAAFAAAALALLHEIDATLLVLFWNLGPMLVLVSLAGLLGRRVLAESVV